MSISVTKQCSKCLELKPADRKHFGSTPKGNLRNECRACMNKRSKAYSRANPESVRRRALNRQKQSNKFKPTDSFKIKLAMEQEGRCALCGELIDRGDIFDVQKVQVEHLIPVSKGGANNEENLVLAHRTCNQEKAGKTMFEYWLWRQKVGLPEIKYLIDKVLATIDR